MRRRSFLYALGLALLPGLGFAGNGPAVFVVHPYDTPSRLYARFRPLTLWLGGVTGRTARFTNASSYAEQIARGS